MDMKDLYDLQNIKTEELLDASRSYSNGTRKLLSTRIKESAPERLPLIYAAAMTEDEQTVLELLALEKHCSEEAAPYDESIHHLLGVIRGLHEYRRYKSIRLDTLQGEELTKVIVLISLTSTVLRYQKNNPPLTIVDLDDIKAASVSFKNHGILNIVDKYYHRAEDFLDFLGSSWVSEVILAGLHHTRWYGKQALSTVTEETINVALDYLDVTAALHDQTYEEAQNCSQSLNQLEGQQALESVYIDDLKVESLIEHHPEQIRPFINFVRERRSSDIKLFREYTDNGTVLRTGVL